MRSAGSVFVRAARNVFLYLSGLMFLALAKAQNVLKGYSTPKRVKITETQQCIEYDLDVVEHWLHHLRGYVHGEDAVQDRDVLELGPGSDLGTGLYLLLRGAKTYNACDVNDLAHLVPDAFYDAFFERVGTGAEVADLAAVRAELAASRSGRPSRLNYVVRDDFDLVTAVGANSIDIVFSQAAFEHFDDVDATVEQLTKVCRPGAIVIAEIDLQTHSRWIREKDPNNVYRYAKPVYRLFWFRGIPNRVRPYQYVDAFRRQGWTDIRITPLTCLGDQHLGRDGWHRDFQDEVNEMDQLTILLAARLPD